MRRNRSLGSIYVVLLCVLDSQALALTVIASVPPAGVPTQVLSSVSVVLTTTNLRSHSFAFTGLSASLQFSDSGTPTTSSTSSSASTLTNSDSDVIAKLPLAGPMIAGVLVGIIVIAAIVVICFLQRRPQHPRRRRRSFEAQFILQPDSGPHRHSRSRFLRDENPENAKKNYRRYSRRSRYSTRLMELEVRNSVPPGGSRSEASLPSGNRQLHSSSSSTNSTFSLTLNKGLNTNKICVNIVDASQTSVATISPPTTELPLQPLSSPSEFIETPNFINPSLLPEVGGERLNTLSQQRSPSSVSGNTSDKAVYETLLLEKQIEIVRRQDVSLVQDNPPPYERRR